MMVRCLDFDESKSFRWLKPKLKLKIDSVGDNNLDSPALNKIFIKFLLHCSVMSHI